MKEKLEQLNSEAKAAGFDDFASRLIEGCNTIASKFDTNKANVWFDRKIQQVYQKERIYVVMSFHNYAMKKSKGVAFSGTADILFGRLCQQWYNY